jgi:hypothetical protein
MTLNLLPVPPARLDVDQAVRDRVSTLLTASMSVQRCIGRHWTTEASLDAARKELLNVAREALLAHELLG